MGQGFAYQRQGVNVSAGTGLANTGTVSFSNANNVSFGMNSNQVITASVQPPPAQTQVSYFDNGLQPNALVNGQNGGMAIQRVRMPQPMAATRMDIVMSNMAGGQRTFSMGFAIYTMSASTAIAVSTASMTTAFNVPNLISVPLGTWSITAGEYLVAFGAQEGGGANHSFYGLAQGLGAVLNSTPFFADAVITGSLATSLVLSNATGQAGGRAFFRMIGTF